MVSCPDTVGVVAETANFIAEPGGSFTESSHHNDVDSIAAGIHLYGPEHFIFPFLAHALGAFTGALMAHLLTAEHKERLAWKLGSLSLLGGITAATLIPAPAWYIAVDLVFAYLPMAYLAILVGRRVQKPSAQEER